MRKYYAPLVVLGAILLANCATGHRRAYNYPEDIPAVEQEKMYRILEKGRVLYSINCAQCHGAYSRKHDVPSFTKQQMDNYGAKFMYKDPENHAVAAKMDGEELAVLFMFLRMRKQAAHKLQDTTGGVANPHH